MSSKSGIRARAAMSKDRESEDSMTETLPCIALIRKEDILAPNGKPSLTRVVQIYRAEEIVGGIRLCSRNTAQKWVANHAYGIPVFWSQPSGAGGAMTRCMIDMASVEALLSLLDNGHGRAMGERKRTMTLRYRLKLVFQEVSEHGPLDDRWASGLGAVFLNL